MSKVRVYVVNGAVGVTSTDSSIEVEVIWHEDEYGQTAVEELDRITDEPGYIEPDNWYVTCTEQTDLFKFNESRTVLNWIYHNPDANSGDQYVHVVIGAEKLKVLARQPYSDSLWSTLQALGDAYLWDPGESGFEAAREIFTDGPRYPLNESTWKCLISEVM